MMMVGSRLADYDLELTVFRCSAVVAVSIPSAMLLLLLLQLPTILVGIVVGGTG